MPRSTFSPLAASICSPFSLACVSRVSTKPKATALQLILNWPHSLASVFVRPTTPALRGRVVDLARVAHRARDRGDVDDLAEDLLALGLLGLGRLAPVRGDRADHPEGDDRVDVEHRLELLVGHPVDDAVPGVAGVVDDDVDRAEGLDAPWRPARRGRPARSGRRRRRPSRRRSRDAACSATSPSMSLISTLAPSLTNSSAVARPMPRAEPVTIAALPSSSPISLLYVSRCRGRHSMDSPRARSGRTLRACDATVHATLGPGSRASGDRPTPTARRLRGLRLDLRTIRREWPFRCDRWS